MWATELPPTLSYLWETRKFVYLTEYLKNTKMAKAKGSAKLSLDARTLKTLISHFRSFSFFFQFYLKTLDISQR